MNKKNKNLHAHLEKMRTEISLSHNERIRMRNTLNAYMQVKHSPAPSDSTYASVLIQKIRMFTFRPLATALVVVLFVASGGVSYAAQSSLPNDFLYPIKININEPARGIFAISASAKTAWAMQVAGDRIKEITILASEGRLSTSTKESLETSFVEHSQKALHSIALHTSPDSRGDDEISARFESQLAGYAAVLAHIGTDKNIDLDSVMGIVKSERDHIVALHSHVLTHITSITDTSNMMSSEARTHDNNLTIVEQAGRDENRLSPVARHTREENTRSATTSEDTLLRGSLRMDIVPLRGSTTGTTSEDKRGPRTIHVTDLHL